MRPISRSAFETEMAGRRIRFSPGAIHTENSYKYTVGEFQDLARRAGWNPNRVWTDGDALFSVHELISNAETPLRLWFLHLARARKAIEFEANRYFRSDVRAGRPLRPAQMRRGAMATDIRLEKTMIKQMLAAALALLALAGPASANCDQDFDAITKAISGPTMEGGHRAAMMRLALSSYDQCMSGDAKSSAGIRDALMQQLRENLGTK